MKFEIRSNGPLSDSTYALLPKIIYSCYFVCLNIYSLLAKVSLHLKAYRWKHLRI